MIIKFENALKFLLFICSLCICVTACGSENMTDAGYTEIGKEEAEDIEHAETDISGEEYVYNAADEETTEFDEQKELTDSEKYFSEKQEHISDISNGQCTLEKTEENEYTITLYDKEHAEVDSIVYLYREPWVEAVTDTLLEINFSVGSPARYTFYFDMEKARISDTFFNSILFGDQYIAYMAIEDEDEITLILTDLFKEQILYQEIIRDFSLFADYMGAVIGIEMIDEQNIRLEYYEGADMTIVSEIIALNLEKEAESISGWEGNGTFLIYSGNYYAAHLEANIFTEIKWEDGGLKEEVRLIEYDTRDSRQAMEGKEGYYILKDITGEEEKKLWYGIDGLAELSQAKEYVWEDEDLKRYKQLFYEEDSTGFSGKGGVIYQRWDGLFAWEKSVGYTMEDRTFSAREGEWSVRISYPYFSDNSSYTCTDEVNQAIEQELRNRCKLYCVIRQTYIC